MKKITFFVAGLLLTGSFASATPTTLFSGSAYNYFTPVDYRDAAPVIFMERGIEFMVFTTGELDFNTQPATTGGVYYKGGRGANAGQSQRSQNQNAMMQQRGVRVEQDYMSRIRRVGNVYINYDAAGRVKRIGSVFAGYNNFGLNQIGGLSLQYDRYGRIINSYGVVNRTSYGYVYQPVVNAADYNTGSNQNNGSYSNYHGQNNNANNNNGSSDYYYRTATTAAAANDNK